MGYSTLALTRHARRAVGPRVRSTEGRQGVGRAHGITIHNGHDGRSVCERHGVSVSGCAPPFPDGNNRT